MEKIIAPSILAADFSNLQSVCQMLNRSRAEWVHIDVMDGVFVPNISFGFPVLEAIKRHCVKTLDVHLMIRNPEKYIQRFRDAGADIITFHLETVDNPQNTIDLIRKSGAKVGVTINPNVPVAALTPVVKQVDMALLMSVFAGFGGQKFIPETFERVKELQQIGSLQDAKFLIEIDGGICLDNAHALFDAGANILVAGNCIFHSSDPTKTIDQLLNCKE
ncbi:MAG: ribulose-phosphate 3-epimerase [Prevotellaceae bacterium]|jgi:ribulose-phosphate 3-epimerase|nr:ribulose-phosphate 3-epimerase [Prevotellaceae bacterium]